MILKMHLKEVSACLFLLIDFKFHLSTSGHTAGLTAHVSARKEPMAIYCRCINASDHWTINAE